MRHLLLPLTLSALLLTASTPEALTGPPAAAPAGRLAPPGKLGRWVNKRTRPIGLAVEKVLPFRLTKRYRRYE